MTDAKVDLNAYVNKKIKFMYRPPRNSVDEQARECLGVVFLVNDAANAMLLKEHGAVMHRLIELDGIDYSTLVLVEEPPRELKQKTMPPVTLSGARFHLLHHHGGSLAGLNGWTDQEAFDAHNRVDHSDHGHVHENRTN
jgi:hypothetical protein